jgi:RHS repeat-associated protein
MPSGMMSKTTDYSGNMVYENGTLKRTLIADGYIEGGVYHYYLTDHLSNNRVVVDANGTIVQTNHYYPFGMGFADNTSPETQPYKYNNKELDQMNGLNWYDNVARFYDPAFPHTPTMDRHAENYYGWSPYSWVANNPMKYIDPNGEDVYLFYYINDNYKNGKKDDNANRMFWAAAVTRAIDIAKNLKDGDKAIIKSVSNTNDFKSTIEGDIAANKDDYGPTKEVGIWSHAGLDGPLRHDQNGNLDQLPVSDWGDINFNWKSDGASISFYGCQTGRENKATGQSFNETLSGYANFNNVDVWGQTRRSWPSPYTNMRYVTDGIKNGIHGYPTYMVGSEKFNGFFSRWSQMPASIMSIYQNGKLQRYRYQPGKRFY